MNDNDFILIQNQLYLLQKKGMNRDKTRRNRNNVINDFIEYHLEMGYYVNFFTFTFTDEFLNIKRNNLKQQFRRYAIKENFGYLLFSDYGSQNTERFHLHGYVITTHHLNDKQNYFNKFGWSCHRPILKIKSNECLTSQFYLSQKNFNDRIDRLWKHLI